MCGGGEVCVCVCVCACPQHVVAISSAHCNAHLKSIRVHLDPESQLVCMLTQTLVILTTVRIFVANLRVELVRAP